MQDPGGQVKDPEPLVHELLGRATVKQPQRVLQSLRLRFRRDQFVWLWYLSDFIGEQLPVVGLLRLVRRLRLGRFRRKVESPGPACDEPLHDL
jgi:hypothetical protein